MTGQLWGALAFGFVVGANVGVLVMGALVAGKIQQARVDGYARGRKAGIEAATAPSHRAAKTQATPRYLALAGRMIGDPRRN